jgi:tetratricopeptide (TPR) repeat protein
MAHFSHTFRIFVSSTFTDFKEERNALQREVFPRLRKLCEEHDCRFQAIDLRWGVREEAVLDQRAVQICIEEIKRCQHTGLKPNFIMLLGDRYGRRPAPYDIRASLFEHIVQRANAEDEEVLRQWYRRDDNAVPAVYCLVSRTGDYVDYVKWEPVERRLREILQNSAYSLQMSNVERLSFYGSVTEQEIYYGALNVPDADEHVFCFFRIIEGLPHDTRGSNYMDIATDGRPDVDAQRRLSELKAKLREKVPQSIKEYKTTWRGASIATTHLNRLCEDVYACLSQTILREIQKLERVDSFDREVEDHRTFGEGRASYFTGRESVLREIRTYVDTSDHKVLTIHGPPGSGKTALMARAAQQAAELHPDAVVVGRFVGATAPSSDVRSLLENLCRQIARCFGEDESLVPMEYDILVQDFQQRLARVSQRTHASFRRTFGFLDPGTSGQGGEEPLLVLFIDALDQLSDAYDARRLMWLQTPLPDGVRVIVSTLPGEPLTVLEERPSARRVTLPPMPADEGKLLLERWLAASHRTLQPLQRDEVLSKFAGCSSPLYLKLAFEEARRWHSFSAPIPLSSTIAGIIGDLVTRLSHDHSEVLVSHSIAYLAAARYGLPEDELLDVLSRDRAVFDDFIADAHHSPPERRLPVVVWSRLFFELEPYMTERNADGTSLLTFYHAQLGAVVAERFLGGPLGRERRLALAAYFDVQPLFVEQGTSVPNRRKVSELPFQLSQANAWGRLYDVLQDMSFLNAAWDANKFEVRAYWTAIERHTSLSSVTAYRHVMDSAPAAAGVYKIWSLWYEAGHLDEAQLLAEREMEYFKSSHEDARLQIWLRYQAFILRDRGELDEAMALFKEEERICRELGDKSGLQASLGNQATILRNRGEVDEAMALHKQTEQIFRELGDKSGLVASLGNQASILRQRGDPDGATALFKQTERICRELGDKDGLRRSLGGQALILRDRGELDEAMALREEEERICRELGNKDGLSTSLGNQALILGQTGDPDGAMALFKEEERICRELGYIKGLSTSLFNQALVLAVRGKLDEARSRVRDAYALAREHGYATLMESIEQGARDFQLWA